MLVQNVKDMAGFLVIVTTFIVFFAFAFLLLFSTHPCVRDEEECFNDIIGADHFDDTAKGLASYPQSLLTIFNVSEANAGQGCHVRFAFIGR